jgi:hypothetical protein
MCTSTHIQQKLVAPRLQAIIVEPGLATFVTGLRARILVSMWMVIRREETLTILQDDMAKNPARWKIPLPIRSIVYDAEYKDAVGKTLTGTRSNIKIKVCLRTCMRPPALELTHNQLKLAFKNGKNSGEVVRSILPDNMEPTEDMMPRWAWMVSITYVQDKHEADEHYEQQFHVVEWKGADKDLWPHIDKLLAERRKTALEKPESEREAWFNQ